MKIFISKIVKKSWFYPLVLLLIGLVSYGVMITRLGFYWDDWESVYLYYLHNPSISFQYYAERPLSALTYLILFPFAKMTPIVWQFVGILLRWAGVSFIYYTLTVIWPKRVWQNRWIGALLFVFPGYLNQPVSVAFSQHLTTFALFACSLFLTVLAIKNRKLFWLWMPLSVLVGMTQIFMMEYFVGLEIIRPIIIWFMLQSQPEKEKKRVFTRTLLYWLPFLVGLVIYVWWRLFYLPSTLSADPNDPILLKAILGSPVDGLTTLIENIYRDVGYLLTSAWAGAFSPDIVQLRAKMTWFSWFLGLLVAVPFGFYLYKTSSDKETAKDNSFAQVMILGCVALVAGAAPVWSIGRQIAVGKWSDRFALGPMLGAVILVVCLIEWLIKTRNQKQWLLIILLASSMALQIYNGNKFRLDWELQRNLYWQLSWRIPNLKPGTAVVGSGTFTEKSSFYAGMYVVNLLFDKDVSTDARYGYFDIWHFTPDNYYPGIPIIAALRGGQFSGNTSQAIGIFFTSSEGCVRILDKVYYGDPSFNDRVSSLIAISNLDQITAVDPQVSPDPAIFGTEPSHGWCYYFEKADLARQMQDWEIVLQLGSEAESKGLAPAMGAEYLPFIEAYAQTGQWPRAFELSAAAQQITPDLDFTLCDSWNRFSRIVNGLDRDTYLAIAKSEFCEATDK